MPYSDLKLDVKQQVLLQKLENIRKKLEDNSPLSFLRNKPPSGVYLYGSVGNGKTVLLQLFYEQLQNKKLLDKKLMIHYQDFIQSIHQKIHQYAGEPQSKLISKIAMDYARLYRVICLDEFEIKDITDAMIIGALIDEFIKLKLFLFVTSNTKPDNLYKDGLQRSAFLPIIKKINQKFEVLYLDNNHDYRLAKTGVANVNRILYPFNEQNQLEMNKVIAKLSNDQALAPCYIEFLGRKISFTKAKGPLLITDFDELFNRDLSYIDYINICQKFTTILVQNVRIIDNSDTNIAVRFINFIDNAYFYKVTLFMNMETAPEELYQNGYRSEEFKRTISRLHELKSSGVNT